MINPALPVGIALYEQLKGIAVRDDGEPFVCVDFDPSRCGYEPSMNDMESMYDKGILIRRSVAERLERARMILRKQSPVCNIYLTYGYRSSGIQAALYRKIRSELDAANPGMPESELLESAHRFIAVPDVAGHPTGGAVDVTLVDDTGKMDMGSALYDFTDGKCRTFEPGTTSDAMRNRLLLRMCMMEAGFMPFDGEYWHFSYGDREWAFLSGSSESLYEQKKLEEVVRSL